MSDYDESILNSPELEELELTEMVVVTRRTEPDGTLRIEVDSDEDEDVMRSLLSCGLTYMSLPSAIRGF